MVSEPAPTIGHDRKHHDSLEKEDNPGAPVEDRCHRSPGFTEVGLLDDEDRDRQESGNDDGPFEPLLHSLGA